MPDTRFSLHEMCAAFKVTRRSLRVHAAKDLLTLVWAKLEQAIAS